MQCIPPTAGTDRLFLDETDEIFSEPGVTLRLDEQAQLVYDWRPLPSGDYFIGFEGENIRGESSLALIDILVDNAILAGDGVAYLDPYLGFQFQYPPDWYRPVYRDQVLFTTSPDGRTRLRAQSLVDSFEGRDQWLASGMETGVEEGYAKLDALITEL